MCFESHFFVAILAIQPSIKLTYDREQVLRNREIAPYTERDRVPTRRIAASFVDSDVMTVAVTFARSLARRPPRSLPRRRFESRVFNGAFARSRTHSPS